MLLCSRLYLLRMRSRSRSPSSANALVGCSCRAVCTNASLRLVPTSTLRLVSAGTFYTIMTYYRWCLRMDSNVSLKYNSYLSCVIDSISRSVIVTYLTKWTPLDCTIIYRFYQCYFKRRFCLEMLFSIRT